MFSHLKHPACIVMAVASFVLAASTSAAKADIVTFTCVSSRSVPLFPNVSDKYYCQLKIRQQKYNDVTSDICPINDLSYADNTHQINQSGGDNMRGDSGSQICKCQPGEIISYHYEEVGPYAQRPTAKECVQQCMNYNIKHDGKCHIPVLFNEWVLRDLLSDVVKR